MAAAGFSVPGNHYAAAVDGRNSQYHHVRGPSPVMLKVEVANGIGVTF